MRCDGIAVCTGCVLERSYLLAALPVFDLEKRTGRPLAEAQRAMEAATGGLRRELAALAQGSSVQTYAELIEVQLTMLEDEIFQQEIAAHLGSGYAPSAAVLRAAKTQEDMLAGLGDEYLAARADDVHDLGVRLACRLEGVPYPSLEALTEGRIVLAHDLLPSMLMSGQTEHIRGIVIENGTKTSHVSILASGLEIPMVAGCKGATGAGDGRLVYMDGEAGYLEYALTEEELAARRALEASYGERMRLLRAFAQAEAGTSDGQRIELHANIVDPITLDKAIAYHVDGVGLFRTEFLYMNRDHLPTEEEQFATYAQAAQALGSRPLIIRTMDIGGDKGVEYLHLPQEENPFMGCRAVRLCLRRKDLIMPQLRAILRANAGGNVWVMFPMIAVRSELTAMKAFLEEAKEQLRREGVSFPEEIKTGIMVEVPSAVVLMDQLGPLVDFVSIGSNDLVQYVYAADRMNPEVGYLYDPMDPAVLRMIAHTVREAERQGIVCSLCGEMAGDALGLAVLLALGLTKVSVSTSKLLATKQRLSMLDASRLRSIGAALLDAPDSAEVLQRLREVLPPSYPS